MQRVHLTLDIEAHLLRENSKEVGVAVSEQKDAGNGDVKAQLHIVSLKPDNSTLQATP